MILAFYCDYYFIHIYILCKRVCWQTHPYIYILRFFFPLSVSTRAASVASHCHILGQMCRNQSNGYTNIRSRKPFFFGTSLQSNEAR